VVSTEPARLHIHDLGRQGMGYLAVAFGAGVNHNIVWGIRQGLRPQARYGTVQRILDVDLSGARNGTRIPAGPTWQILDRLIADGYTRMQLSRWLGSQSKFPSIQIPRGFCTTENASRVERLKILLDAGKLARGDPSPLQPVKSRGVAAGSTRPNLLGKPRSTRDPRCACGRMTLKCARARAHHCRPEKPPFFDPL
jgi:hypothetical protein